MTSRVVLLESAERDLKELRKYLLSHFSVAEWNVASKQIKLALQHIKQFPLSGHALDLLPDAAFNRFRQSVTGRNRIVYEKRGDTIYVHAILDTRRSYMDLLRRRGLTLPGR